MIAGGTHRRIENENSMGQLAMTAFGIVLLGIIVPLVVDSYVAPDRVVARLDLTDVSVRSRATEPTPGWVRGRAGGAVGGRRVRPSSVLAVMLLALEPREVRRGAEIVFEIQIKNAGSEGFDLPWTPHSEAFVLPDNAESLDYRSMSLSLCVDREAASCKRLLPSVTLYGSPRVPDSTIRLLPGDSVVVRARVSVVRSDLSSNKALDVYPDIRFWREQIVREAGRQVLTSMSENVAVDYVGLSADQLL